MLHLSKSRGKFFVATLARNYLSLTVSQPTGLSTRKGAFKNIRAQMKIFGSSTLLVQDDTNPVPVILKITQDTIIKMSDKPEKPYVPNPKAAKSVTGAVARKITKKK